MAKSEDKLFAVSEEHESSSIAQYIIKKADTESVGSEKIEQISLLEFESKINFDDGRTCYISPAELTDESKRYFVTTYNLENTL